MLVFFWRLDSVSCVEKWLVELPNARFIQQWWDLLLIFQVITPSNGDKSLVKHLYSPCHDYSGTARTWYSPIWMSSCKPDVWGCPMSYSNHPRTIKNIQGLWPPQFDTKFWIQSQPEWKKLQGQTTSTSQVIHVTTAACRSTHPMLPKWLRSLCFADAGHGIIASPCCDAAFPSKQGFYHRYPSKYPACVE